MPPSPPGLPAMVPCPPVTPLSTPATPKTGSTSCLGQEAAPKGAPTPRLHPAQRKQPGRNQLGSPQGRRGRGKQALSRLLSSQKAPEATQQSPPAPSPKQGGTKAHPYLSPPLLNKATGYGEANWMHPTTSTSPRAPQAPSASAACCAPGPRGGRPWWRAACPRAPPGQAPGARPQERGCRRVAPTHPSSSPPLRLPGCQRTGWGAPGWPGGLVSGAPASPLMFGHGGQWWPGAARLGRRAGEQAGLIFQGVSQAGERQLGSAAPKPPSHCEEVTQSSPPGVPHALTPALPPAAPLRRAAQPRR